MLVSIVKRDLFDDGEEHVFVVTGAVGSDIVGKRRAKRFFVLFFDGCKAPLIVLLETKVLNCFISPQK